MDKSKAIELIHAIQSGNWDRHDPEPPKGKLAEAHWHDDMFAYGMEYGAIVAAMQLFGVTKEDISGLPSDDDHLPWRSFDGPKIRFDVNIMVREHAI